MENSIMIIGIIASKLMALKLTGVYTQIDVVYILDNCPRVGQEYLRIKVRSDGGDVERIWSDKDVMQVTLHDKRIVMQVTLHYEDEDNIFQADQRDAFDSDVEEAPTAQIMFMVNLFSADLVYDEAGPSYDSDTLSEVEIGYKNPFYLSKAKQVQPSLYNGHEIVTTNHARALVHDSEDTLESGETTRNQMIEKIKDPECVKKKFVKKPPVNKVWRVKQVKQVWQATGKLFANVSHQWIPTRRNFTLGEQCPLTRFTQSKVVPVKKPENVSTERLSSTSHKPLTRLVSPSHNSLIKPLHSGLIKLLHSNNMANENIHAPAPTRSDDQILPFNAWFDEDWFTLDANLLRKALKITPIDQAQQFMSPLSSDVIMDFVNELGYPKEIHFVSRMAVNNLYQPWRAILSMINQCLTDKTFGFDRPIYPVLQILWAIITYVNVKSESPINNAEDDYRLGNLKFVPKGEEDEVFGMQVPKDLITDNMMNAPYYNAYLEMPATAKQPKPVPSKPSKPAPTKKPKVAQEKPSEPSTAKQPKRSVVRKVHKRKNPLQLVDKEELAKPQHDLEPQVDDFKLNIERAIQISLESFQAPGQAPVGGVTICKPIAEATQQIPVVEGNGKGIVTDEQAALLLLNLHKPKKSTTDQYIFQRHTPVIEDAATRTSVQPEDDTSTNIIRDNPSPANAKTEANTYITTSTANTKILYVKDAQEDEHIDKDQAGPNPGQSHVALDGPNPEPMHDDFIAIVYLKVHEILKHTIEEHVHLENPLSLSGTFSSMKNLDDTFTFDDQLLNDKCTNEEPRKATVETKAKSMATVPIHQASTLVPPLSALIIDLSPLKPVSSSLQESFIIATTEATTTTLLLPLPPPPQRIKVTDLVSHVSNVENKNTDLEQKILDQDKIINALGSRVYTPENHNLEAPGQKSSRSSKKKQDSPSVQPINEYIPIPDDVNILDSEDTGSGNLPKITTKPIGLSLRIGKKKLTKANLEGPAYMTVKPFHTNIISLQFQMEECHQLLTDKIDLVNTKGHQIVPDVTKLLPLGGPPGQLMVSHTGGLNRRNSTSKDIMPPDRHAARSYMRILSVISLKMYERYSYIYLSEIVLSRADYNEYKISEADFKNLHLNDFKDLYLLHLQGKLNHLPGSDKVYLFNAINMWNKNIVIRQRVGDLQLGIKSYQTKLNLTQHDWDASEFLFKE
nr:hypothetical protein [Tanacetum cinerariifolium]